MINNKKILSVVTARSGSVGVLGKNYKILLNRPLVQWSILASLKCPYIDLTVVSSNCAGVEKAYTDLLNELQEICRTVELDDYISKLRWIPRPDEFATPTSKNEDAMIHAYHYCKDKYAFNPSILINMQPTSPCRNDKLLSKCLEEYEKGGYDSLLTGQKLTPFLWKKQDGKWVYPVDKNHCCDRKMRQDFLDSENNSEFVWHDCGSVYCTNTEVMLNTKCRIGENPCLFTVDRLNSLQIDTEFDFILIENMIKAYDEKII